MNILKEFDAALAVQENLERGYRIEGKEPYESYLSNEAWDAYVRAMDLEHRRQYGQGSGGELEPKNGRPPKMASVASSSRMIYELSKDVPEFAFEKQLTTVLSGIANLDGYLEKEDTRIFVEAKCREPYGHKAIQTIKRNYKPVYSYLREKMPRVFSCVMEDLPDEEMRTVFFCRGEAVASFDIKQMISHMLAVANEALRSGTEKKILFLYLLFDPSGLPLSDGCRAEVERIHSDTCRTAERYRMEEMFGHIVNFLIAERGVVCTVAQAEAVKKNFRFVLCDQEQYRAYLK